MTGKQGSQANLAVDVVAETTPLRGPCSTHPTSFAVATGYFAHMLQPQLSRHLEGGLFGPTCNFLQVHRAVQSAFGIVELSCGLSYHAF